MERFDSNSSIFFCIIFVVFIKFNDERFDARGILFFFLGGITINNIQKREILKYLSIAKENKNYSNSYLIPYIDYFEPIHDIFTDFNCENQDGKKAYMKLINKMLSLDANAKIYVEVYGEEDNCIYADTLILCSRLSLEEVTSIFNVEDLFPSDIVQFKNFDGSTYVMNEVGELNSAEKILDMRNNLFYCWWD